MVLLHFIEMILPHSLHLKPVKPCHLFQVRCLFKVTVIITGYKMSFTFSSIKSKDICFLGHLNKPSRRNNLALTTRPADSARLLFITTVQIKGLNIYSCVTYRHFIWKCQDLKLYKPHQIKNVFSKQWKKCKKNKTIFPTKALSSQQPSSLLMLSEALNSGALKPCLTVMSCESYPHFCTHACTHTHRCVLTGVSELRDQCRPP